MRSDLHPQRFLVRLEQPCCAPARSAASQSARLLERDHHVVQILRASPAASSRSVWSAPRSSPLIVRSCRAARRRNPSARPARSRWRMQPGSLALEDERRSIHAHRERPMLDGAQRHRLGGVQRARRSPRRRASPISSHHLGHRVDARVGDEAVGVGLPGGRARRRGAADVEARHLAVLGPPGSEPRCIASPIWAAKGSRAAAGDDAQRLESVAVRPRQRVRVREVHRGHVDAQLLNLHPGALIAKAVRSPSARPPFVRSRSA